MNIIFAVPDHKNVTYQRLSQHISGSSTGTLENESQNVVALVSSEYEVILIYSLEVITIYICVYIIINLSTYNSLSIYNSFLRYTFQFMS